MKVLLAKHAGFCMGVRRAVETTLEMVRKDDNGIATFGPLIHNPQVLSLLEDRGVRILKDLPDKATGTIIIRAHGIPPLKKEALVASGAQVQDATCPRVVKVQAIIDKWLKLGYSTVIIGDRNHAEVEGLMGFAGPDVKVVSNEDDIHSLAVSSPYIIVSQTTQDEVSFGKWSRMILDRFPDGKVFNTICDSTHKRQEEVRDLCNRVQAMVVVGGRTSANTQRLGEIAASMGRPVFMVEKEEDLDIDAISRFETVGVTAGASTPSWMINWVVRALEAVPSRDENFVISMLKKLFWLMLTTNIYISIGGGLLTFATEFLLWGDPKGINFIMVFGYLFSMHNLNRFTDQRSKKINDPIRAIFYSRFRWPLLIMSAVTLAISLTISAGFGQNPFILLLLMSVFGILYSVRIIPKSWTAVFRVRRLKEIPGSKTFFVAIAWACVVVLVPSLELPGRIAPAMWGSFAAVFFLAYVRSALFDVFDVVGDRIVGKETLPVCIGEKKTIALLYTVMIFHAATSVVFAFAGLIPRGALAVIPGIVYIMVLTKLYQMKKVRQGPYLEFGVDAVFYIVAILLWTGTAAGL